MIEAITKWLQSGANPTEGVQLMQRAGVPSVALSMLQANPKRFQRLMVHFLTAKYGVKFIVPESVAVEMDAQKQQKRFRQEFPFLAKPDCPMELQALATQKITLYHEYIKLHAQLGNCKSLKECADKSKSIINAFMENRAIWEELNYYREHGAVLGKHAIFASFQRRKDLLNKGIKYLFRRQKQLQDNIWHAQNEIKKGTKPYLDVERRARIKAYEEELAEVNRLLDE